MSQLRTNHETRSSTGPLEARTRQRVVSFPHCLPGWTDCCRTRSPSAAAGAGRVRLLVEVANPSREISTVGLLPRPVLPLTSTPRNASDIVAGAAGTEGEPGHFGDGTSQ